MVLVWSVLVQLITKIKTSVGEENHHWDAKPARQPVLKKRFISQYAMGPWYLYAVTPDATGAVYLPARKAESNHRNDEPACC